MVVGGGVRFIVHPCIFMGLRECVDPVSKRLALQPSKV